MTVLALLALWIGVSALSAGAMLWAANHQAAITKPAAIAGHDPAECEICQWVDDAGVVHQIDWALWAAELEAAT